MQNLAYDLSINYPKPIPTNTTIANWPDNTKIYFFVERQCERYTDSNKTLKHKCYYTNSKGWAQW